MVAACGGGGGTPAGGSATPSGGAMTGRGPITLASGKDTSRNLQNQVDAWNKGHPNEQARIVELPESADVQRDQMIQNARAKSDAFTVLSLDVVWTSEFAANRWILPLPQDQFDLSTFLPPTVATGQYRGRLYAAPWKTDAGLLYYRKDLLDKAGIKEPPKTWQEMEADCKKVPGVSCFAGQYEKYEGLTCNFSEAVNSAGGTVVDPATGRPDVNTPAAKQGLDFLVAGFKNGVIPEQAITFKEEEGRRYFQEGKLLFHRQWPYQYALADKDDGSSKVAGKFAVAPLPGLSGPGAPTLGGHNLAVSAFAENRASALDFVKFLASEERQRANLLASSEAPTLAALYDDPELQRKYPYLTVLKESVLNAKPRPQAVRYGDVTAAIQEAAYAAISGARPSAEVLVDLQAKLQTLTQS
ncbi:MAG: ABC transporter substrate-binding protein [Nonomuraea sp.]|nr:ABC transporter substrate-binding protein [Nonomuraea sp.]NUR92192.1 ABC transporter substrate-binding protein [Nonomuraea sp.]